MQHVPLTTDFGVLLGAGFPFGQFLPILLMVAVFYFLVWRPNSNQEQERRKRLESIKKGDHVVLSGGLLGRVSNLDDPKIAVIELADRVKVRVLRKEIVDTKDAALSADAKDAGGGGGLLGGLFGGGNQAKSSAADGAKSSEAKPAGDGGTKGKAESSAQSASE